MSSACGSKLAEKAPGFEEAAHYAVTLLLRLGSGVDSISLEIFTFILALGFKIPSVEPVTDLQRSLSFETQADQSAVKPVDKCISVR